MKTAVLLIFALVFASLACAASCVDACGDPDCHQHQPSTRVCSHELVLDRAPARAVEIAAEIVATIAPIESAAIDLQTPSVAPAIDVHADITPPLRI